MARNRKNRNKNTRKADMAVIAAGRRREWIAEHGGAGGWRNGGGRVWTQENGRAKASKNACRTTVNY